MRRGLQLGTFRALSLGAAVLRILWGATAHAVPLSRLVYVRGPGADTCPLQMALRLAVVARLGYDPFSPTANKTIVAVIERNGDELHGRIELVDSASDSQGVRELAVPVGRCWDLVRAMALSMSIAIDPERASAARDSAPNTNKLDEPGPQYPELVESNARDDAAHETSARASLPRRARSIGYFTGFGLHVTLGAAPAPASGAELLFGGRYRRFSLSFEGRADAPAATTLGSGAEIRAMFLLASAVPCLHLGPTSFCGLGTVGMVRASSRHVTWPSSDTGSYTALGGRIGVELPVGQAWAVRIHADALTPRPKVHVQIRQGDSWDTPTWAGLLGAGLVVYY